MRRVWFLPAAAFLSIALTAPTAAGPAVVVRSPIDAVRFKAVHTGSFLHTSRVPADIVCNANYYWKGSPLGLVVKDGRLINGGIRHKPARTAFVVQKIDGRQRVRILEVWARRGRLYSRQGRLGKVHTLVQAGPRLVTNGRVTVARRREGFESDVARRTKHVGLGITRDGSVLLVAQSNVTLREFARTFVRLGARDAMNLDGGHSATISVNRKVRMGSGRLLSGLAINYPKKKNT